MSNGEELVRQHEQGQRIDNVTHMCPECGPRGSIFCRWCMGAGNITTERLADWQREENLKLI